MENIREGMPVLAVDDSHTGSAGVLRDCCFDIAVARSAAVVPVTYAAVFNVTPNHISLICGSGDLTRYACDQHAPTP